MVSSTIEELRKSHALTGNKGNIIHAEAPAKLFINDTKKSCFASIIHLFSYYKESYASFITDHFDVVVLSVANFIRVNQNHSALLAAVKALPVNIKLIVLGGGIQENVAPADLTQSTNDLVRVFNERSAVFGVRGEKTKDWIEAQGMTGSVVLGCPSLYLYPQSILHINGANLPADPRIISAGHLSKPNLSGDQATRGAALYKAFQGAKADYVFQDEIFSFTNLLHEKGFYDESTGECSSQIVRRYIEEMTGAPSPMQRFWYFYDASAWRQACTRYDIYIGDRFHGGIAAMQARIPALFLQHDARVNELTDYFRLPTLSLAEFSKMGIRRAIDKAFTPSAISDFHTVYKMRLDNFRTVMLEHGVKLSVTKFFNEIYGRQDIDQRAAKR